MGNLNAKCKYDACNRNIEIIKGISKDKLKYCSFHKCSIPTCKELKIETSSCCKYHKCAYVNCNKQAYVGTYCGGCYMKRKSH